MSIEDALGLDPQDVVNDLIAQRMPAVAQNGGVDPQTVVNRLIRSHGVSARPSNPPPQSPSPPSSHDDDFGSFGRAPESAQDFGAFGRDPEQEKPAAKPQVQPPDADWSFGEGASVAARSAGQAAVKGTGSAIKLGAMMPEQEKEAREQLPPEKLGLAANPDYATYAAPFTREVRARENQQRAAQERLDKELAVPLEQRPAYKTGQAVQNWAESAIPVTPQERAKYPITSGAAGMVGGAMPAVLAGAGAAALGGPVAGAAVGGAVIAAQSAGDEFDRAAAAIDKQIADARSKGDTATADRLAAGRDQTAAHAAGFSAEVNGALGALPIGVILGPVKQIAPQLTGRAWAALTHAAESGVTFAGVGEAQEWLGQQIAKTYDPNAHYDFDAKRLISSLLAGGVIGGVSGALQGHGAQPESAVGASGEAGAGPAAAESGPQPQPGPAPPGAEGGAGPGATARPSLGGPEAAATGAAQPGGPAAGAQPQEPPQPFATGLNPRTRKVLEEKAFYYKEFSPDDIASWSDAKLKDYVNTKFGMGSQASDDDVMRRAGVDETEAAGMSPEERKATAEEARSYGVHAGEEPAAEGTRAAPVDLETGADVRAAAAAADQEHTPAQGEANNISRGHARWNGLDITIEAPSGGVRRGVAPDGTPFEQKFTADYGYFKGVVGKDGDQVDVYVGPDPGQAKQVYVLNENDEKGQFRQTKSFIGFPSQGAAIRAYLGTSGKAPEQVGSIVAMPPDGFKAWLKTGDHGKPASATGTKLVKGQGSFVPVSGPADGSAAPIYNVSGAAEAPGPPAVTPAHREAVTSAIAAVGEDPAKLEPPDLVERAAAAHAAGLPPAEAVQAAIVGGAVDHGVLTEEQAKQLYGNKISDILHAGQSSQRGLQPSAPGAATGGPVAEAAALAEVVPGRGEARQADRGEAPEAAQPTGGGGVGEAGAAGHPEGGEAADYASYGAGGADLRGKPEQAAPRHQPAEAAQGAIAKPATPKRVRQRQGKPQSLIQFLAGNGGIRSDDRNIADLRSIIGRDNLFVPGYGNLIRAPRQLSTAARTGGAQEPKYLDEAREVAVEGGYLEDEGLRNGTVPTSTVSALLDQIEEDHRGNRQYAAGEEPAGGMTHSAREQHEDRLADIETAKAQITKELKKIRFPVEHVLPDDMERAAALYVDHGYDDPLAALERAAIEAEQSESMVKPDDSRYIDFEDLDHAVQPSSAHAPREAVAEPSPAHAEGDAAASLEASGAARGAGESGERDTGATDSASEPGAAGERGGSVEPTAAGEQHVLPGAERISDRDLAQRRADTGLKPKAEQKPADEGLFGDGHKQGDLVDMARAPVRGEYAREVAAHHLPWYDKGYRGEPRGGNEAEQAAWDRGALDASNARRQRERIESKPVSQQEATSKTLSALERLLGVSPTKPPAAGQAPLPKTGVVAEAKPKAVSGDQREGEKNIARHEGLAVGDKVTAEGRTGGPYTIEAMWDRNLAGIGMTAMARLRDGDHQLVVNASVLQPAKPAAGWTDIGKNEIGQTLYEDQRGIRSYIENGVRHTEPVLIAPTREGVSVEAMRRALAARRDDNSEWKLASERALPAAPPATNIKGEESPNGLQSTVPASDARAQSDAVQGVERSGRPAPQRDDEIPGGGTHAAEPAEGRAEGQERRGEPSGSEGGGGESAGGPIGLPGQHDHSGAGRERLSAQGGAALATGGNHLITPGALDEGRSFKTKAEDNVRALELARQIDAEARPATQAEQAELARYVGWGGIKGAFPDADGKFGKGFEKVGEKLKDILSPEEYKTAQRSIQYAHYTAEDVVRGMWRAVERMGFKGGSAFEPGMGVGNFAGMRPSGMALRYAGIELDHTTARIAKLLYPEYGIRQGDFTRTPLPENTFDLVIGNPPFADVVIKSDPKYAKQNLLLHDYFFAKSLDSVRPGGLLAFISSAGTMNKLDASARNYLADRADLAGAIRLPSNAFAKNAGTEVTTDIVFLRKRLPGESAGDRSWTETKEVTLPDKAGTPVKGEVNRYFAEHPEMVLGEEGWFDKLYEGRYAVHARKGEDFAATFAAAIDRLPAEIMAPAHEISEAPAVDLKTQEKKEGTFYVGPNGQLHQVQGGAGVPLARRGAGVEGGKTAAEMERIRDLIPVRDALREVYAADLADDRAAGDRAREALNRNYDAFVAKYGPINKADIQHRRPTSIQEEGARAEAREEARYAGEFFNEGSFDPSEMVARGATLSEIARARKQAREAAQGRSWDEGSFDPGEMPDVIIDRRPNVDPFMDDQESYRLRAIEHYDEPTGRAEKSRVFTENVVSKLKEPEIKSVNDAVLHVLNREGSLDLPAIAQLIGKSEDETIGQLGDRIFRDPGANQTWVTRDEYLSGNVRKKLALAKEEAAKDPSFQRNVDALEAAQPTPLGPSQIRATLGMPWIPEQTVRDFGLKELGLESLKIKYIPALAQWVVSGDTDSAAASTTWGTDRRRAPALLSDALNHQTPKIFDPVKEGGKNRTELNVTATTAAQEKLQAIRNKFINWIYADPERADTHAALYNEHYNNLVDRQYDGSYLTTPGVSTAWDWRPHQTRVIARIIQSGNTYMAHAVGAGKTSAMIGAGMEMRRLGLVRKPMYAVPNHMLAQFTKEFYEQYPTARIAVADERRFHTDRRKQFIANVANEDLDAVIITHSAFGMIPISDAFADKVIQDEVDSYRALLSEIPRDTDNRITRGRIEKQIERLEQRLSGRGTKKRDQVFTFDEMGTDFLFVDEAHVFRKLDFATNMGGIKGISPEGSAMAWDLYVKSLYLDSKNPGRSLVLASGTPVTNTMAELYTISRYLQRDELTDRGLAKFDAWAGAFGTTVSELEQDAAGGYKSVARFARFVNVPELSAMVRQSMDVVTSKQLEQYVVRPKIKGGKRQLNVVDKSPALERYQASLADRMRKIEERKGPPKKGDDIMLSVINDGRHAAIDMRLVGATADKTSKLNVMVANVFKIWKETKAQKFYGVKVGTNAYDLSNPVDVGPATQMIFANLGLSGARGFSVPDFIRSELVRRGVPKAEIAFIADYKTHVAKQKLFNDMNEGKVRILIGSTQKMATGVNAQRRLYAIHNQDPLWYPSDDEQRNGRGLRQGNMNPEIEIHDYSTKGTYDSTMWGMMARKGKFIQGFFEGDPSLREMDDLGEAGQYEQAKAITTNDPRLIKLTELRQDLEKAERKWASFDAEQYAVRQRRAGARNEIKYFSERVEHTEQDIAKRQDIRGDQFVAKVGRSSFDKRVDFGDALLGAMDRLADDASVGKHPTIGEIAGFPIIASTRKFTGFNGEKPSYTVDLSIRRSGDFERKVQGTPSALGLTRSLENAVLAFEGELEDYRAKVKQQKKFLADSETAANATFQGDADIKGLRDQVRALEAELAAPVAQPVATDPASISSLDQLHQIGSIGEYGDGRLTALAAALDRGDDAGRRSRIDTLKDEAASIGQEWARNVRTVTPAMARSNPSEASRLLQRNADIERRQADIAHELEQLEDRSQPFQPSRGLSDEAERNRLVSLEAQRNVRRSLERLTPAAQGRRAALESALTRLVQHVAGPGVHVRFHEGEYLPDEYAPTRGYGDLPVGQSRAMYFPSRRLIEVAMGGPEPAAKVFHEAWHDIEFHLLNDREIDLLKRETDRLRPIAARYLGIPEWAADKLEGFEVRAYAFEAYQDARSKGAAGFGIHVGIRAIFERIMRFLRQIGNTLRGLGFHTVEDLYESATQGEYRGRQDTGPRETEALARLFGRKAGTAPGASRPSRIRDLIAHVIDNRVTRKIMEGVQDLSLPVKQLQRELETRRSAPFEDRADFYTKKRLYPGRIGNEVSDFNREFLDPMVEAMKKNGISLEEAGDYLYAKHVEERNNYLGKLYPADHEFNRAMRDPSLTGASGRSVDWADAIIKKASDDGKTAAYERIAGRVHGIREYVLSKLVDGQLLSPETAAEWRSRYKNYVDLRGFEDAPEEAPTDYREPARFNVRGKETKQAFGRQSKSDNPIINMVDQAYRAIERAERNRYLGSVWDALRGMERTSPGSVADIVQFDKGKAKKVIDSKTGLVKVVDDSSYAASPSTVSLKIGGEPHHLVFENRDIAEAIKRMSPDGLGVFQGLMTIENKLKALWTHYSPDFLFRHFMFRYPIEGTLNSFEQKEAGKHSVGVYIKNSFPFLGTASRAIFAANKGKLLASTRGGEMQKYWDEMRQAGGAMTFRSMRDMDLLREHLETQLLSLKGRPIASAREKWRRAIEAMDVVTNTLDNALRLSAYASARKQGKSPQQAALIAREATVDFQLKGKWSNAIGLWWPFGNIATQTGFRMSKAVARSRIMRRVFMGTALTGFMVAAFNYLVGGDDQDGIPFFEKIPEWERRLNFIILNPYDRDEHGRPTPIKIPMPYNWAFPLTLGYAFGARVFGKEKLADTLKMAAHSGVEVLTPFGQEENIAAMLAPELSRPAIYIATNEDYAGRPVHQNPVFQRGPNAEAGRRNTGEGWKHLASHVNELTGGTPAESGAIDVYPEDYRQAFNYVAGAQYRLGRNLLDIERSIAAGQTPSATKLPLERVVRGADYDAANRSLYYDQRKEVKNAEQSLALYNRHKDGAGAARYRTEHQAELGAFNTFKSVDQDLGKIRKRADQVRSSDLPPDQKESKLQGLEQEELAAMARARSVLNVNRQRQHRGGAGESAIR